MYLDNYLPQHAFADTKESIQLFQEVDTFQKFKNKLKKLSIYLPDKYPVMWNVHSDKKDNELKILGDGFELFVELLVVHFGFHPHIGLVEYKPIEPEKDKGIDAWALNISGLKSAVQCKYKSDETTELTANTDHLSNFLVQAGFEGINYQEESKVKKLFIFTTAKGLHYFTKDDMYHNRIRVIGVETIKQLVDNNILFWNSCTRIIKNYTEK